MSRNFSNELVMSVSISFYNYVFDMFSSLELREKLQIPESLSELLSLERRLCLELYLLTLCMLEFLVTRFIFIKCSVG